MVLLQVVYWQDIFKKKNWERSFIICVNACTSEFFQRIAFQNDETIISTFFLKQNRENETGAFRCRTKPEIQTHEDDNFKTASRNYERQTHPTENLQLSYFPVETKEN